MSKFVFSMHSTFFFLAAIATIVMEQGFLFLRDLRERELRASQLESQLAVAQWQNLRSQLNPHFLFNVLNTSASQLLSGKQEVAHTTLVKLSELLRLSLEQTEHQFTTLNNEVQFASRYLELVQARFPDRLKITIAIDPETTHASVPTLLLQPLVENAIKYGVSESTAECAVQLQAYRENSQLILHVSNSGDPIIHASSNGTGVGLKNLRERLQYLYRDTATVSLSVSPDGGADARVTLPFSETNE
jgi:LytS/YehU family sensor histidine kinase